MWASPRAAVSSGGADAAGHLGLREQKHHRCAVVCSVRAPRRFQHRLRAARGVRPGSHRRLHDALRVQQLASAAFGRHARADVVATNLVGENRRGDAVRAEHQRVVAGGAQRHQRHVRHGGDDRVRLASLQVACMRGPTTTHIICISLAR